MCKIIEAIRCRNVFKHPFRDAKGFCLDQGAMLSIFQNGLRPIVDIMSSNKLKGKSCPNVKMLSIFPQRR